MATCKKCGKELPEGQKRCPDCYPAREVTEDRALRQDLEEYVSREAPAERLAAEEQIQAWSSPHEPQEVVETAQEAAPVLLARAPTEVWAHLLEGWLEGEGVQVLLESKVVPTLDTATAVGEGYWGDVLVHAKDLEKAREVLRAFETDQNGTVTEAVAE
ncbi:MAG TPA: DUF2007 domain-containing protein [Armatimonadota bacterium]|jgi:hypothetical protein